MHIADELIDLALKEDIGLGDITTDNLIAPDSKGSAVIVAKEDLTICGFDVAKRVFQRLDPCIKYTPYFVDGAKIAAGQTVLAIEGHLAALLSGERTALNFLQRLSGIATLTRSYLKFTQNTKVKLVDTRKTTPGLRALEKYAVRMGGGFNHRTGLYDGVLIKDNHIAACGGIREAVTRIRSKISHLIKIEVETASLAQVKEALVAGADVIMLDNMDPDQIRKAVALINAQALVEVSGGVTTDNLAQLVATGVDLISIGALTHSARAVDLSMRIHS
jgi:nicotinate-nucleotide pyrophosphorylase (carboxylating)